MEESRSAVVFFQVPLMSKDKFAELSGFPYGVVDGWCDRGHLPTKVVGKHRLVNLALLTQECLEELSS